MFSQFLKNTFSLAFGNAFCQALAFLLVPFITRLFEPEQFGFFSFYISIVLFLGPVSNFRFSAAVFAEKDPKVRVQLFSLSYIALVISFFLVYSVLEFLYSFHNNLLMNGPNVSLLIACLVCLVGAKQNAIFYATNSGEFKVVAKSRVLETIVDKLIPIAICFLLKPAFLFLIVGRFCSLLLFNVSLFWALMRRKFKLIFDGSALKQTLAKYRSYALYSSLSVALNSFSRELPLILFPLIYTPEVGGYLALGFRIVRLPIQLVAESISKTFVKEVRIGGEGGKDYCSKIQYAFMVITVFIVVPLFVVPLFSDLLVPIVFGDGWNGAVSYIQIVSVSFFVMVYYVPISVFYDVLRMEKIRLAVDVWTAVITGLFAVISYFCLSPLQSIICFVGCQAIFQLYGLGRIFHAVKLRYATFVLNLLPLFGLSTVMIIALVIMKIFVSHLYVLFGLVAVLYAFFFVISVPKFIQSQPSDGFK